MHNNNMLSAVLCITVAGLLAGGAGTAKMQAASPAAIGMASPSEGKNAPAGRFAGDSSAVFPTIAGGDSSAVFPTVAGGDSSAVSPTAAPGGDSSAVSPTAAPGGDSSAASPTAAPDGNPPTASPKSSASPAARPTASPAKKDKIVLKKKKGGYSCYKNGKRVRSRWMTVKGNRYYFAKNGFAVTLSTKIKGTYYIFDRNGKLMRPSSTKVLAIGKKKYQVTPSGKAKKGWSKDKKHYFDNKGEIITGIRVLKGSFYAFSRTGTYNAAKTKKLRQAAKYKKDFSALKKLIGEPQKAKYYSGSCYGDGSDGVLSYKGFTVYTFKAKNGKETFLSIKG